MKQNLLFSRFSHIKLKYLLILMLAVMFFALIVMNILFYAVSSKALEEQFGAYFFSVSTQIEQNVRANNTFVENAIENTCNIRQTQTYLQNGNDMDTHKYLVNTLLNTMALNDCIETIKIFSSRSFTISAAEDEPVAMFMLAQQYNLLNSEPEKPFFTMPYLSPETQNTYYAYVYPIRSIALDTFREYLGTAVALINLDKILSQQNSSHYIQSTACFLMDENNTLLFNTGGLDATAFFNACRQKGRTLSSSVSAVQYQETAYYYTSSSLPSVNWQIFTAVPQSELSTQTVNIRIFTVLLSSFSALLILTMAILLMRSIYRPIHCMAADMSKVSLGDRQLRIQIPSHNELGELASDINAMLDELNASAHKILTTQNNLYEMELAEKKSQMLALQSQINPHFLYNTLECMQSIAMEHHVEDVVTITASMAKIFRYAIGDTGSATLEEELTCVQRYLSIMRIRFVCEARLDLDIPHDCLSLPILRMTLQPIVENAFTHGLEKSGGEGFIRITAQRQTNTLVVCVLNSGGTLSREEADSMNQTLRKNPTQSQNANINGGLAVININRRLWLAGTVNGGVHVSITDDGLTCFTLVFPCS